MRTAPLLPSSPGERITSAPKNLSSSRRSPLTLAGITQRTGWPVSRPIIAIASPVLPLVGSRIVWPGRSEPSACAASSIARAIRSLTEPLGF